MAPSKAKQPAQRKTTVVSEPDLINPQWLAKALGLTILAALICAYCALCLLYYQGTWQLVLHPSHTVDRTPASLNLPFTSVRFGDFDTGEPHLTGWWLPADSATPAGSHYGGLTLLYLHSGSGSLSSALPDLALLHAAGLNIFAIDYRGFGASAPTPHPNADRMGQDADAAFSYLVSTRHIPPSRIVPYGTGLGGAIVVHLAQGHPELRAIVLDQPNPDPAATAAAATSAPVPIRWLFGGQFEIASSLATLPTSKLLLTTTPSPALRTLAEKAAPPKTAVELPSASSDGARIAAIRHFVDQYLLSNQ